MLTRTLLLGGARSGKSSYAEALLAGETVDYLATARRDPTDREWEERIAGHIARRPRTWRTVEPPTCPRSCGPRAAAPSWSTTSACG